MFENPGHTFGGNTDLLEVVLALNEVGGLANLLHRRQKKRDENSDDCDHDQQFNQRKTGPDSRPQIG